MVRRNLFIRHDVLRAIKTTNYLYDKLLNYRTFLLPLTTRKRTGNRTGKIKYHIKILDLTLRDHQFDGSDPTKVLIFLSGFSLKCDTLAIT